MKEEYYWDEIQGVGKLYTDIELVVGFEPVLFVCTTENNSKYLVMTYDSCNGVYVLIKINNKELLNMLENKITMEKTFRNGTSILKTYIDDSGNMQYEAFNPSEFDENLLPRKNEFFDLKSKYILKYIEKLKREEAIALYIPYMSDLRKELLICNPTVMRDTNSNTSYFVISESISKNKRLYGLTTPKYMVTSFPLVKKEFIVSSLQYKNVESHNQKRKDILKKCVPFEQLPSQNFV